MTSPITGRHEAVRDICRSLGLTHVRSFSLNVDVDSAATVTVERLVMDDEMRAIHAVLVEHGLVLDKGVVLGDVELQSGDPAYTQDDDAKKYVR